DRGRHARAVMLQSLLRARRLVVRPDSRREIAIEVETAQERRVAVDVAARERRDLRKAGRVGRKHAGKVHELGKTNDLGMSAVALEVGGLDARARRLEMRRRHAARKLYPQVHRGALGA